MYELNKKYHSNIWTIILESLFPRAYLINSSNFFSYCLLYLLRMESILLHFFIILDIDNPLDDEPFSFFSNESSIFYSTLLSSTSCPSSIIWQWVLLPSLSLSPLSTLSLLVCLSYLSLSWFSWCYFSFFVISYFNRSLTFYRVFWFRTIVSLGSSFFQVAML